MVLCRATDDEVKMNGDLPSVPITTLSGVASLSTLLPDLPLPAPLPQTQSSKLILYDSEVRERSADILRRPDSALASELINAVRGTTTQHLDLKEVCTSEECTTDPPQLMQSMLARSPGLFLSSNGATDSGRCLNGDVHDSGCSPSSLSPSSSDATGVSRTSGPPNDYPSVNGDVHVHNTWQQQQQVAPPDASPSRSWTPCAQSAVNSNYKHILSKSQPVVKLETLNQQACVDNSVRLRKDMHSESQARPSSSMMPRLMLTKLDDLANLHFSDSTTVDLKRCGIELPEKRKRSSCEALPNNKKYKPGDMVLCIPKLEMDDDNPILKKFKEGLNEILSNAEEMDLTDESADMRLCSRTTMTNLVYESAKLKNQGTMRLVRTKKLVKVLTLLQYSIRCGRKIVQMLTAEGDADSTELLKDLALDKSLTAVDASQLALNVMTAPNMPKEVYIEDVIENVQYITKSLLSNCIYPEFDPVYRLDNKDKAYQSNNKQKRARAGSVKDKSVLLLYNKLTELVGSLAELITVQELTDTTILQASTLSVGAFFVENISELQLSSLTLVTNIFARYEKHRQLIVEDILASLARLPSSKKNLRTYRLGADTHIQMVTALTLQLIQSVVRLPSARRDEDDDDRDDELLIHQSFDSAMQTAHNFLTVFLQKCSTKGEEDYRPLFENFVNDLLTTVNKPEWPASEYMLSMLGSLLVKQFSNKQLDMPMRTSSLDYLGTVAARLRKDAVSSSDSSADVQTVLRQCRCEDSDDEGEGAADEDDMRTLQKAILHYLVQGIQTDPALAFARKFYLALWFRDIKMSAKQARKKKRRDLEEDEVDPVDVQADMEAYKEFLMEQISKPLHSKRYATAKRMDYDDACCVTRYLASKRPFSKSFDVYLKQILKVLCETAIAVRSKAMKCLTAVVEADPGILARPELEHGVHARFLDQSTSVREAAVELVGKFILIRPELTSQYYKMLQARILDTGISVRKRVIKIFKDICIEQPDFERIPEICVLMIRRVNDEEGIKKLVNETFQSMWFVPVSQHDTPRLLRRVLNITDVVAACKDSTGCEWFEHLLQNLLKKEGGARVGEACRQVVNCLVQNVLRLEEIGVESESGQVSQRLVACLTTLYLFCKTNPVLLVDHAMVLQPYLNIRCSAALDAKVVAHVASIMELTVPKMDHPSESFLKRLEEDLMRLILRHGKHVVQSCVSCLGAVVNRVTKNFKLAKDCFQRFYSHLNQRKILWEQNPNGTHADNKSSLYRALFTMGLFARYFDFDSADFGNHNLCIGKCIFNMLHFYMRFEDEEVRVNALMGMGSFCVRHHGYMTESVIQQLYHHYLSDITTPLKLRIQVLANIQMYLTEEERRMILSEDEYNKSHDTEDLKEMGDLQSGMASTIIQLYIRQVLEAYLHPDQQVRMTSVNVVALILRQGLLHPVQIVPYLVAMGADPDMNIRTKSDQHLQEIDKKYPGFLQMKAIQGIRMSYRLHHTLALAAGADHVVRGLRESDDSVIALNHFIYACIRNKKDQRRAVVTSLLSHFDESTDIELAELVYIADNIAHFPYQIQDEPLFIIHHIDTLVSITGSNLLQSFREVLTPVTRTTEPGVESAPATPALPDEDDDDVSLETVIARLPADLSRIRAVFHSAQGCLLALFLKNHLKHIYSITDIKLHQYSPTDLKANDRPIPRRTKAVFSPKLTLDVVRAHGGEQPDTEEARRHLAEDYLDFKQLMLNIDPAEDGEGDADGELNSDTEGASPRKPAATPSKSKYSFYSERFTAALLQEEKKSKARADRPKPRAKPSKPKPKKKRRRRNSDSSDDSVCDPDWV